MDHVIYKFPLPQGSFGEEVEITVPQHSEFLDIQFQDGVLVAWYKVPKGVEPNYINEFIFYATGQPFSMNYPFKYLKTLQHSNGLVYHLYGRV